MAVFQKDGSDHILIATAPRVDFHHWSDFQDRHMLRKALHRQMPKLWDATIGTHERMIAAKAPATQAMKHSKLSFGDRYVLPAMGIDLRNIEILGAIVCASQRARGFRLLLFVDKDTYAMWGDKDMAIGIVEIPLPDGWEDKESFFLSSKDRDIAAQLVDYSFGKSSFGERMGQLSDLKSLYDLRILSDTADLVMLGSDKRGNKHIQMGVGKMPEAKPTEPRQKPSSTYEDTPSDSSREPDTSITAETVPASGESRPTADDDALSHNVSETHAPESVNVMAQVVTAEPVTAESASATVLYGPRPIGASIQGNDAATTTHNEGSVPVEDGDDSDDFQDYTPNGIPMTDDEDTDDFQDYAPESGIDVPDEDDSDNFADYVPDVAEADDEDSFQDYVPSAVPVGTEGAGMQVSDAMATPKTSHNADTLSHDDIVSGMQHGHDSNGTFQKTTWEDMSESESHTNGKTPTSKAQDHATKPHDTADNASDTSERTASGGHADAEPHARPSETSPSQASRCRKCGLPLPDGAAFCIHCGARVESDESSTSPVMPQRHMPSPAPPEAPTSMRPSASAWQGTTSVSPPKGDDVEDSDDGFSVIDFEDEMPESGRQDVSRSTTPPVPIEARPKPAWNTPPKPSQPTPPGTARVSEMTRSLATADRRELLRQAEAARSKGGTEGRDLAFALVCDQVRRQGKGEIPESQIDDALSLHSGGIVVTQQEHSLPIVMTAFAHALSGHQVHVMSEDDETARKAASFASDLLSPFEVSVGFLYGGQSQVSDDVTYGADIIYGPPSEFGCDYLRHTMDGRTNAGMRFDCVIIDDAPATLVDSASVPFSIRRQGGSTSRDGEYVVFAAAVRNLVVSERPGDQNCDIVVDRRNRRISTTANGAAKIKARLVNTLSPTAYDGKTLTQRVQAAMQAEYLLARDRDYVVRGDNILLIDPRTKTVMRGRRWSGGLQEAVEAKEGLHVREQGDILASIAVSDYFKRYAILSGFASDDDGAKRVAEAYGLRNNLMVL